MIVDAVTRAVQADPAGGVELIKMSTYTAMLDDVDRYRGVIAEEVVPVARERVAQAKAGLGREYVAKMANGTYPDDSLQRVATWLAGIDDWLDTVSKASEELERWNLNGKQTARFVARDAWGRFASLNASPTRVIGSSDPAVLDNLAPHLQSEVRVDNGRADFVSQIADPAERDRRVREIAQAQGEFEQLKAVASEVTAFLGNDAEDAQIELKVRGGGRVSVPVQDLADGNLPGLTGPDQRVTAFRVKVNTSDKQVKSDVANFNLLGRLFGKPGRVVGANKDQLQVFFQERLPSESRLTPLMARLGIAGNIMSQTSPNSTVGAYAQLVGAYGPEAERMLRPHLTRAAYRYRGTEKTPDKEMRAHFTGADKVELEEAADALDATDGTGIGPRQIADEIRNSRAVRFTGEYVADDPAIGSMYYRAITAGPDLTGDQLRLGVRSDMAAMELAKTLPKAHLVNTISRDAGHVPPSQGVIIDADGDLVSQSVGFSDDHYLPFNLANLGRLRGGQYVRTRQQGGLTGEDIFASVYSGARSATVVSTSGVFRLEMAPDFRGARGMSDKAQSMYDRYLKILEAIEASDRYTQDIDAADKAKIETEVTDSGYSEGSKDWKREVDARINAKRSESRRLAPERIDALRARAEEVVLADGRARSPQDLARAIDEEFEGLKATEQGRVARQLNLNGEGYALALQTLQQQFPYFIRTVEYEPLRAEGSVGFAERRGGRYADGPLGRPDAPDKGYVKPGKLTAYEGKVRRPTNDDEQPPRSSGTGGGGGGAPAAAANEGVTAPADTSSPAARMAADKGKLQAGATEAKVAAFLGKMQRFWSVKTQIGGAQKLAARNAVGGALDDEPWSRVKTQDPKDRAFWLMRRKTPAEFAAAVREDPRAAFEAFASDKFGEALNELYPAVSANEMTAFDSSWGGNSTDLISSFQADAQEALDALLLEGRQFRPEGDTAALWDVDPGGAIGFRDLTHLGTPAAVKDFLSDRANADVAAEARRLGFSDKGYLPYHQAVANTKQALDALKEVKTKAATIQGMNPPPSLDAIFTTPKLGTREVMALGGFADENELKAALGIPGFGRYRPEVLDRKARAIQRGRTLLEVVRASDLARTGDPFPKDPALRIKKERGAGSWFPRVAAATEPISKAVAMRRQMGLPLTSTGWAR